jgi:predicted ATP-dependent endonuclease of OLD family
MHLKFITIRNFRGIDKLEKLEISNLNTFVGKNDSGKSIILRALDCFFDVKKFNSKDIFKGKPENEVTGIELSFLPSVEIDDLSLDSDKMITIKKEFQFPAGKTKTSEFYLCFDFIEEKYQDLWNKKEQDLNQIVADLGQEPNKSGRGKKNILRLEQIKTILTDKERKDTYHELGDFLKNLEKTYGITMPEYSFFDAERDLDIEATNFQSQFKPIISSYFEATKDKTAEIEKGLKVDLATEFEEIRKFMTKNVSGLKKLDPATEFDWTKSLKKFDLNLEFEGQNFDVPISHKGTGFKRLLMVAYFEYLASKKNISNQIFAIEEPETYLHPSAQEDLLNSITRISQNSQFFLTTHSPIFAGATEGKNSILVTKDDKGISHYSREEEDIIEQIINELGIRPDYNLLKGIKYLIFVEGKDDIYFLNCYAKTVIGKDLEKDNILCVIGGGGSLKNYADLDLFRKLKGNNLYSVIVDGDDKLNGKERLHERLKNKCDADGAEFVRLTRREIENYCHPKAICRICTGLRVEDINIESNTDVTKHLRDLGLERDFKNKLNVDVFGEMTKAEWGEIDSNGEIKQFIEEIYRKIENYYSGNQISEP